MTNPYPLPRSIRETEWLKGDGRSSYGPFDFKIFDIEDVRINLIRAADRSPVPANFIVSKVIDAPFADFRIDFAGPLTDDFEFQVQGARVHERSSDLFRGGSINSREVEKETSKQGVVLQEVRRDIDEEVSSRKAQYSAISNRMDNIEGDVADAVERAERAADSADSSKDVAVEAAAATVELLKNAQDSLEKAETAVQPDDLKALAYKDKVGIEDVEASGTRDGTTFLSGDGSFKVPSAGEVADNSVTVEKLANGTRFTFTNRAALRASNLPARFKYDIRTAGYAASGDGGEASWNYWGGTKPTFPDSCMEQDAGGGWWVISDKALNFRQFGAKGDGSTNDATAINNCLASAKALGKHDVPLNDGATYVYGASLTVPANIRIVGDRVTQLKRGPSVNAEIAMSNSSSLYRVVVDGNRPANPINGQAVLVRIGDSSAVTIEECIVRGSNGYLVAINSGRRCNVKNNTFSDFYMQAVAVYSNKGDNSNHVISGNRVTCNGWAAFILGDCIGITVEGNIINGVLIGGRTGGLMVTKSGTTITRISGDASTSFDLLTPGQFVIANNGMEFRIVSIASSVSLTVEEVTPNFSNVAASAGTGDMIGVIACEHVTVRNNIVERCATFGMGLSIGGGSTNCSSNAFINNIIKFAGKNGINVSLDGGTGGISDISILGNKIFNAGFALGNTADDRDAIRFDSTRSGGISGVLIDGNSCVSYSGTGQTRALVGRGANVAAGDLVLGNNMALGTINGVGS